MKTIKSAFISIFVLIIALNAAAQSHDHSKMNTAKPELKTETIKVWGKCDMCKARIEKTAKSAGAATATWDINSQMLKVTYDPSKTGTEALCKRLASVGHDTEKFKAPDDVYARLPECCLYERQK